MRTGNEDRKRGVRVYIGSEGSEGGGRGGYIYYTVHPHLSLSIN